MNEKDPLDYAAEFYARQGDFEPGDQVDGKAPRGNAITVLGPALGGIAFAWFVVSAANAPIEGQTAPTQIPGLAMQIQRYPGLRDELILGLPQPVGKPRAERKLWYV